MKIPELDSNWSEERKNTLWLRLHTDEGLVGLGETYYVARRVGGDT